MEHKNVSKKGDPVFALQSRCEAKYLEAYSPLPPPVMVRRHTLGGTSAVGGPPATDIDIMDPAMYLLFSTSDFYRLLGMYLQSLSMYYVFSYTHLHIHKINKREI